MSSSYFSKICKELNSIDGTISIQIKKDKINFYTVENSEHVINKIENFNEYNV